MSGCDESDSSPVARFPSAWPSSSSTKTNTSTKTTLTKMAMKANRLPSFTDCLEVSEMFHLRQHRQHLARQSRGHLTPGWPGESGGSGSGNHHHDHVSGAREGSAAVGRSAASDSTAHDSASNSSGRGDSDNIEAAGPREGEGVPTRAPTQDGHDRGRVRETGATAEGEGEDERESDGSRRLGLGMGAGWCCVRSADVPRPTLSAAVAQGALGLDAFVGRKGRSVKILIFCSGIPILNPHLSLKGGAVRSFFFRGLD